MTKPDPMGSTFAERVAAAKGETKFADPTPALPADAANTTFAQRAGGSKAITESENKAVKSATSKRKS